jgi:uncharacterized protein YbjT (DUF2867 family)
MTDTVLIAGATGWLGKQIAQNLLDAGACVRLLIRGGEANPKAADLAPLVSAGATLVAGDLTDHASLNEATKGVTVVISAVQGGPDVVIEGQVALAKAAKANGARLMIPSDFAAEYRDLTPDRHLFLSMRAHADRLIAETGLPQINVLNGAFLEMLAEPFMGLIDVDQRQVQFWGSADQPYDFTATADVAALTAAVALDHNRPVGGFHVIGETVTPTQIAATLSALTGTPFTLVPYGTLAELDTEIARLQAAEPHNPMAWAGLQYHRIMASGSGKLTQNETGAYLGRAPKTVEAFLREALTTHLAA